jgi:hypothetical protein
MYAMKVTLIRSHKSFREIHSRIQSAHLKGRQHFGDQSVDGKKRLIQALKKNSGQGMQLRRPLLTTKSTFVV